MGFDQESAVKRAKQDLAERLGISEAEIGVSSVSKKEFPDMSLGAPEKDEMAAQMIATGYEYRADKYQLRIKGFKGGNHVIVY